MNKEIDEEYEYAKKMVFENVEIICDKVHDIFFDFFETHKELKSHQQAFCTGKFMATLLIHIARYTSKDHYKQFIDEIYKLTKDIYVIETEHDQH